MQPSIKKPINLFGPFPLNLQLKELGVKINLLTDKHPNLLANAHVTFKFETGEHFTITGFSIWKSKFEGSGLNITQPQRARFQFCYFEKSIWNKIKKYILDAYDYETIAQYNNENQPLL